LLSSRNKYILLFLREDQSCEESLKLNKSLEGCTKEHKNELEEFLKAYMGVFQDPKGLPPKRKVEIRLYRQYLLESNQVKKQL
jgi:hypothetical protein